MNEYILPHIRAVLFDHDDTLVGTIEAKWAQDKYVALTHYGKILTDEELRENWGKPFKEALGILYETDDLDQAVLLTLAENDKFPKKIFNGVIRVLNHLHVNGVVIGIVTSTNRANLDYDFEHHGIPTELISFIQTAEDSEYHKPDPRVFEGVIEWLGAKNIQPDEVLYIGDSLYDLKAAKGVGFNFLGVETGLVSKEEFAEHSARSVPRVGHLSTYSD